MIDRPEALSPAAANRRRRVLSVSPTHLLTIEGPLTRKNSASASWAMIRARCVFPVPGGPANRTPFTGLAPILRRRSRWLLGPDRSTLAPLYDLMSGLSWGNITPNHAQSIGDQQRGPYIYGRHWRRMAEACGLAPAATVRRVGEVTRRILARLPEAALAVRAMPTDPAMLDIFVHAIAERAATVQAHAVIEGPAGPVAAPIDHASSDVGYG